MPAALVYWPHSEEGEEETRERKEEGKEGNGATVGEEGESKGEVNSYNFVMGVCTRNWLFSDESLSSLSCSIRILLCQVDRWERGSETMQW